MPEVGYLKSKANGYNILTCLIHYIINNCMYRIRKKEK